MNNSPSSTISMESLERSRMPSTLENQSKKNQIIRNYFRTTSSPCWILDTMRVKHHSCVSDKIYEAAKIPFTVVTERHNFVPFFTATTWHHIVFIYVLNLYIITSLPAYNEVATCIQVKTEVFWRSLMKSLSWKANFGWPALTWLVLRSTGVTVGACNLLSVGY